MEKQTESRLLEDVVNSGPRLYRVRRQVYHRPQNRLVVTREHICLKPLRQAEATALFEAAVAAYKLDSLDLDDFWTKMLRSILAMCRLAARPEYRVGRRIRFLPLRMDVLPAFV
jgi:hypothetical protein